MVAAVETASPSVVSIVISKDVPIIERCSYDPLGDLSPEFRDLFGEGFGTEVIQGVVQTDAAINPGNSGDPLLNLKGEVVGINVAVASDAENIGFAIPVNRALRAIESVKRTGTISAPYLGERPKE